MSHPQVTTFVLGGYMTNCYVVTPGDVTLDDSPDEAAQKTADRPCWIFDCGIEPGEMLQWIERQNLTPQAIYLTHAHLDHIAGIDQALARFGSIPLAIHRAEAGFCSDPSLNLSAFIGMPTTATEPNQYLDDGQALNIAGDPWRVMHTPGHSPGGVCFVNDAAKVAIVGDTLFAGSIGRFDFPTSDPDALKRSLTRILQMDDDFTIYPGHGPNTTIGRERATNPYVIHGF